MTRLKMSLIAVATAASAASPASTESDTPMRGVAMSISTSVSLNDAQACAVRDVAHNGRAVVIPTDHGVEIDQLAVTLLTKPVDPRLRIRITDEGNRRLIQAFYRHPYSEKAATMRLRKMQKACAL